MTKKYAFIIKERVPNNGTVSDKQKHVWKNLIRVTFEAESFKEFWQNIESSVSNIHAIDDERHKKGAGLYE